ncbi:MAG: class I SAM-dependent methyltransferase [Gemmatimonadales bacterium]
MSHAASITAEYRPFPNEGGRNWRQEHIEIPLMLRALHLPRGARMLEVGCGRGVALPPLARHLAPARLVGLDVDGSLLAEAGQRLRETATRAELVVGDVRRLPFPDCDFDVVIDFGTCFHVARPDDALREIARVLAAGGIFATETRLGQLLSHPLRARGRFLPWESVSAFERRSRAGLWQSCRRCSA